MIVEKIKKSTLKSRAEVLAIFNSGMEGHLFFPTGRILRGSINKGKISARVSPPRWISDAFKSRVNGSIETKDQKSQIHLRVSPSWLVIFFSIIWLSTSIGMIVYGNETAEGVHPYLLGIGWMLIPIVFGKLKLSWDRYRLESWLSDQLSTLEGHGFRQSILVTNSLIKELQLQSGNGIAPIEHMWFIIQEVAKSTSRPQSEIRVIWIS